MPIFQQSFNSVASIYNYILLFYQGSKPSTSSGLTEKSSVDPPTANIKPMAGPATSGSKQQAVSLNISN